MNENERATVRFVGFSLMAAAIIVGLLVMFVWGGALLVNNPAGGAVGFLAFVFAAGIVMRLVARFAP